MTDIIEELSWRGLIYQSTDLQRLSGWLAEAPRTLYAGFDPTADSLHVGTLLGLVVLRRFQQAGHRPIALVGGATGMIGDPSGKSEERNLLSEEQLRANVEAIDRQIRRFIDFDDDGNVGAKGGAAGLLVNNYDWMSRFGYIEFLRDVGKNFPVNVMMTKDSVKSRLGRGGEGDATAGISYTEFSYMLLQAYDFAHLFEQHDCQLQVGGSDQWGNITAGIDLVRRRNSAEAFGMTWPLLTKSDGTKMGKTESGSVWLSAERTSPYAFYQYWINIDDGDVGRCLRYLTELEREEIESLDAVRESAPEKRDSQRRLAEALTQLVHGDDGLAIARRATDIFFGAEIADLSDAQLGGIFADVPSSELDRDRLGGDGLGIVDALVEATLAKSKGEARRLIKQGGVYVNNRRAESSEQTLTTADLASETTLVLRSGKKRYALLRFV